MLAAAPDGSVCHRTTGRAFRTPILRHRIRGSAASALVVAAAMLPEPPAADPGLPPGVQAALTASIVAGADGKNWIEPVELSQFLAAHPERASAVALGAVPRLIPPPDAPWSESRCRSAAGLAGALGAAAPEQAVEIQDALCSGLPECGTKVTQAMEERLATPSSGVVVTLHPQQGFPAAEAGGNGGGGGNSSGCRGGCQTTEPGDPQIVRQVAF